MTKKSGSGTKRAPAAASRPGGGGGDRVPPQHTRNKRKKRPQRMWFWLVFVAVVALIVVIAVVVSNSSSSSNVAAGPEGAPVVKAAALAPAGGTGETIDGISCAPNETLVYHVHVHLAIYVDGQPKAVPLAIGMAPPVQTQTGKTGDFATGGKCLYWLHTHAADGILHIESPTPTNYTLGQFFDIWHQPLGPDQVGPAKGHVTVYVNGKLSPEQNPQLIILDPHAVIQLDVGTVVPPKSFTFPSGV
jgi:hypothetical protein